MKKTIEFSKVLIIEILPKNIFKLKLLVPMLYKLYPPYSNLAFVVYGFNLLFVTKKLKKRSSPVLYDAKLYLLS